MKDGFLSKLFDTNKILVNSYHNYCVDDTLSEMIKGYSSDGVIEALEIPGYSFGIGVQWHPELITDDENSNKILAVSGQNECVEVVDLENDELLDLNMDSNGKEILLLVKDQEKARVCVYKDGKCFRSRKLNPEEYIYSMHLLENGVLLNLQYQKADTVSNRLVWWPFEGEEVSVKVNELYRGVSNNHNSVAFMEFSGQNATMHRIVIQNKKCIMESIKLDQEFSSLPQMLLMEKTTDTCGILVASTQKMLRIP